MRETESLNLTKQIGFNAIRNVDLVFNKPFGVRWNPTHAYLLSVFVPALARSLERTEKNNQTRPARIRRPPPQFVVHVCHTCGSAHVGARRRPRRVPPPAPVAGADRRTTRPVVVVVSVRRSPPPPARSSAVNRGEEENYWGVWCMTLAELASLGWPRYMISLFGFLFSRYYYGRYCRMLGQK